MALESTTNDDQLLRMPLKTDYDYIIAGAGAAGLSLLVRMIKSKKFQGKRILLVDKDNKKNNDRTWCFWETGSGFFEEIIYKSWPALRFYGTGFSTVFDISPYRYKMIRGIDFYDYCLGLITLQPNVTIQYGMVEEMHSNDESTWLRLNGKKYTAEYIFNSIIFSKPVPHKAGYYLLQHFKGWVIETGNPVFNEREATLMDFRVDQQKGTTFVYVMPFTSSNALVEYTLFSKELLRPEEYDTALHKYISEFLGCNKYSIENQEFGSIPMTNFRFPKQQANIIHMGTAGGQTKASSGYTFQFIQKHASSLVANLSSGGQLRNDHQYPKRYDFYDSVLLNVLATGKLTGDQVFTALFSKNPPGRIFRFLDNESSFSQDIRLISSLPTFPFLKAGMEQI